MRRYRVFAILAAFLTAAPSAATVNIICTSPLNGVVQVSYDSSQEALPVRAFALDITVSSGVIRSVDNLNTYYWIYPGSIMILPGECGGVVESGTPVCDPRFPGTLGGLGTSGITIEMGSLYVGEANAPPSTGVLFTFLVSAPCGVHVAENTARGGIVLENPAIPVNIYAPVLSGVLPPDPSTGRYGGGTGTPGNPYLLTTPEQLNALGMHPEDWYNSFKLINDIDMKNFSENFSRIGTFRCNSFKGIFDGNDHRIYNLNFNRPDVNYVGFFGCVDGQNAAIKNLRLVDPNINAPGRSYIAPLVGFLGKGMISACGVDGGNVYGKTFVGGLVGWNNQDGTIINCYSTAQIQGDCSVGGLAGKDYGQILNCYSAGVVTTATSLTGGFTGYTKGAISSSFWDTETSNQPDGVGQTGEGAVTELTGGTKSQLQTEATFTSSGWDFAGESTNGTEDVWTIREGQSYPKILGQTIPGDFIDDGRVDMADFAFFANHWMETNCAGSNDCSGTDLDKLGTVDWADLWILASNWLKE